MASEKGSENIENKAESPKNKVGVALSIVNLVLTFSLCVAFFISFQKEQKKQTIDQLTDHPAEEASKNHTVENEKDEKKENEKGEAVKINTNHEKMIALDPFTVNLSTTGSAVPKFVRVNISLSVHGLDLEEELNSKIPQIRNIIIDLLNSKRESDLASIDGRESLKEEIQNTINSVMSLGKIKGVFFTSFALSG